MCDYLDEICRSRLKTNFKKGLRNLSLEIRIILVEPMYQGNVGSVARAMKNFGYTDLVLVNPCKLEGEARAMSSHARDVLEGAKITSTLDEAVKGANLTIGTTGVASLKTGEHIRLPLYTLKELKEKLKDCSGTIAILFGREDAGFRNDELKSFDMLVTVPTSEIYPIMASITAIVSPSATVSSTLTLRERTIPCIELQTAPLTDSELGFLGDASDKEIPPPIGSILTS